MKKWLNKSITGPGGSLLASLFKEWHNSLKDQNGKTSAPRVTAFLMTGLLITFVIVFYAAGKIIPDNYLSAVENVLMVTLGYAKSESWSWPQIKKGDTTVGGVTVTPPEDGSTTSTTTTFTAPTDGAKK